MAGLRRQAVRAQRAAQGRGAETQRCKPQGMEDFQAPAHGLGETENPGMRRMRVNVLAQRHELCALTQGVQETADAPVYAGLVFQSGLALLRTHQRLPVLIETALGHQIPGIKHAVSPVQQLTPGRHRPEAAAVPGTVQTAPGITFQQFLHGAVLFLHTDLRGSLSGFQKIRQQRGQQDGNILPDQCVLQRLASQYS